MRTGSVWKESDQRWPRPHSIWDQRKGKVAEPLDEEWKKGSRVLSPPLSLQVRDGRDLPKVTQEAVSEPRLGATQDPNLALQPGLSLHTQQVEVAL